MTLTDFTKEFPDEEICKSKFKSYREQVGAVCPKCGGREHYWKKDRERVTNAKVAATVRVKSRAGLDI